MYNTRINALKNCAYLTLKGRLEVTELKQWSASMLAELKKLKPGFGVVSDILECQPTDEEGRLIIQETQRKAKEMGMGNVVRITKGANPVTANQWQRSSRSIGYTAADAASVEDARRSAGRDGEAANLCRTPSSRIPIPPPRFQHPRKGGQGEW